MEGEPTNEFEALTDHYAEETADAQESSDEDFLDDLDIVLSSEWRQKPHAGAPEAAAHGARRSPEAPLP